MPQTAEEYLPILYRCEIDTFGFTGTNVPGHTKELILVFDNALLSQDKKERLENMASCCINQKSPLPDGVRLISVKIDEWDSW